MANFTPTLAPIHEKSPFRFWCQKVLPTVYDDSLSYYELLTKVVYYLNENTQDLETVNSNVEALYNSYVELQNYVNNYFDQNFPELVEQKLDEMVEDGTFDAMLHTIVDPYFELKSEEIDDTLDEQNNHISVLMNQWNNFVHDHAGLTTETQINSNNVTAEGDIWYFTEDITDFTYIDFHHVLTGGNSINPVITRAKAEDLVSLYANQKLTFVYPPNSTTTDKSLVAYMFELEPIPDTSDPEITRAYKDRLRIAKAIKWEWDGTSNNANVTHAVTGTATDTLCGFLDGAFGIKDVQNDAEVIDARVGYNGTIYQSLGQAIRTQVGVIYGAISNTGISEPIKTALLNCFQNVAWKNGNGETYYNALVAALNVNALVSIGAVYTQTGTVYDNDSLDSLKNDLVVTAYYVNGTTADVTDVSVLSGTLVEGTSTITVTYQGKTATFDVTVTAYAGRSDMDEWSDGVAYTDLEVVNNSYFVKDTGAIVAYNEWSRTGYVYCQGAGSITFPPCPQDYEQAANNNIWFKANKTRISSFSLSKTQSTTVTVPSNAVYFGVSSETSAFNQMIANGIVPHE